MLYMYLLTGGRLRRARGRRRPAPLQTQCTIARRAPTNTLEALREELDKNNVDAFVIPMMTPLTSMSRRALRGGPSRVASLAAARSSS